MLRGLTIYYIRTITASDKIVLQKQGKRRSRVLYLGFGYATNICSFRNKNVKCCFYFLKFRFFLLAGHSLQQIGKNSIVIYSLKMLLVNRTNTRAGVANIL